MSESKTDTLVGVSTVLLVAIALLWYFEGFGYVFSAFNWLFATIFGAVISSVISTVALAIGAFVILVLGKRYLNRRNQNGNG